jgi:hypothetical protein
MLENLLEKYDNRYNISKHSKHYGGNFSEVGFKKTATSFITAATNPKPFLDGAITGTIFGLVGSILLNENYLVNTIGCGVGFGLINQQQYYFMMLMDNAFDIFPKSK